LINELEVMWKEQVVT